MNINLETIRGCIAWCCGAVIGSLYANQSGLTTLDRLFITGTFAASVFILYVSILSGDDE